MQKPTRLHMTIPALVAALAAAGAAHGQFDPFPPIPSPHGDTHRSATDVTEVRVLTDVKRIAPGQTFHLIVLFKASNSWHLYWKNPGAGAAAPLVRVKTPGNFKVEPVRWPRPKILSSPAGEMYCHEGEFALFVPIQAPPELRDGAVMLTADISWAVCDADICLMGSVSQTVSVETLRTLSPDRTPAGVADPVAARHAARLPIQVKEANDADAAFADGVLTVSGPAHGRDSAIFVPNGSPGVTYGEAKFTFAEDRFIATITFTTNPRDFGRREPTVGGLIGLGEKVTDPSYEFDLPLDDETSKRPTVETSRSSDLSALDLDV